MVFEHITCFLTSRTNPRLLATGGHWLSGKSPDHKTFLVWHLGNETPSHRSSVGTEAAFINWHLQGAGLLSKYWQTTTVALPFCTSLSSCVHFTLLAITINGCLLFDFFAYGGILVLEVYLLVMSLICIFLVKEVSLKFSKGRQWTSVQTAGLHHAFVVTVAYKPALAACCIICYILASCKNKVVTGSEMKQHRGKNIVASTENNNLLHVVKKYVSFMWCQLAHLTSVAV